MIDVVMTMVNKVMMVQLHGEDGGMQGDEFGGDVHNDIDGMGNAGETVTDCKIGVS